MMQVDPSVTQPQQPTSQPNLVYGHPTPPDDHPNNPATPAQGAADDKPPRDFPAELLTMLGDPTACLAPRPSDSRPGDIFISVETQVMPSGATGRNQVQGGGLTPDEQRCISRRLESIRFGGTIENAPFPVRASLTLKTQAPKGAPPVKHDPGELASAQQLPPSAADKEPSAFLEADPDPKPIPDAPPAAAPTERPGFMQPDPEPAPVPNGPPIQGADDSNY